MTLMPFRRVATLSLMTVLLVGAGPLNAAAAIDQQGAAQVKQMIADQIAIRKSAYDLQTAEKLVTEGDITVTPAGNYYAVTMPRMSIERPAGRTDIGIITMNVAPGDQPDLWKVKMTLPSPIVQYAPNGAPAVRIDIKKQSLSGIWHQSAGFFVKMNGQYNDTMLTFDDEDGKKVFMTAPDVTLATNMSPDAKGDWSGDMAYEAKNITFQDAANTGTLKIEKSGIQGKILNFSPDRAKSYRDQVRTLAEGVDLEKPVSAHHLQGLYDVLAGYLSKVSDGAKSTFYADNITVINRNDGPGAEKTLRIARAGGSADLLGLRDNSATIRIAAGYDGLTITPFSNDAKSIPTRATADITIGQLPIQDLFDLGRKALPTVDQGGSAMQDAGAQMMMMAPQLLTRAGTTIKVTRTNLGNDLYDFRLDGDMAANMNAIMGGTGDARVEIAGLDALIDTMKGDIKTEENPVAKKHMSDALGGLVILQMIGQQEAPDAKGRTVRSYDFALTPEGKMTLNGADLSTIQQLIQAKPQ